MTLLIYNTIMNTKYLYLQVIDWENFQIEDDDDLGEGDDEEDIEKDNLKYNIRMYGKTAKGKSVCLTVEEFPAFFYVQIPDNWRHHQQKMFIDYLKKRVNRSFSESLFEWKKKEKYVFRDFNNNKKASFIQLFFHNTDAMKKYKNVLLYKEWDNINKRFAKIEPRRLAIPRLCRPTEFPIYDGKIEPMISMFHVRNIQPAGWVKVKKKKITYSFRKKKTRTDIEGTISWKDIYPHENDNMSPIKVVAYDIECESSHGDFPQAMKDYKKVAGDFAEIYTNIISGEEYDIYNDDNKLLCYHILKSLFSEYEIENQNIPKVYSKDNKKPTEGMYNQAAVKISGYLDKHSGDKMHMKADIIKGIMNEEFRSIKIEGDKVIQIGSVFYNYGDKVPYLNHIITLKSCDPIPGIEVEAYETEREVLLAWTKLMQREDPDIITGYNIFGFDYNYMYTRAIELSVDCKNYFNHNHSTLSNRNGYKKSKINLDCGCCLDKFSDLGRIKKEKSELITNRLSSAALGNNLMKILKMNGRISIDLLKVVQRDHKLNSFKLDNVSAHFIRGYIKNVEFNGTDTIITTNNTIGLFEGGYVSIMLDRGSYEDKYKKGKKFRINEINSKGMIISGKIQLDLKASKCYWCQAKDDVSPKDIFRLQKGGPSDRARIAKYCVKDCVLCIDLMNKLSILGNNIGMANVCSIPLDYIFLRGQGVKILSLVAKQCRKDDYLLPDLPKFTGSSTYEGAIVLDPNPGVYLENPVAVLDYSSLYPSSMISENCSHETIVTKKEWLGDYGRVRLKRLGYHCVDVQIQEKICRFVQPKKEKDGTIKNENRGIIPRILLYLLGARKNTRKKIKWKEVEIDDGNKYVGLVEQKGDKTIIKDNKNPVTIIDTCKIISIKDKYTEFQKQIFDGLQLAYKVTANSLYGQLGAKTSPVRYIDIAAATTSIGRSMLQKASDFVLANIPGAEIVYGDTDSIFVNFNPKNDDGEALKGKEALKKSIDLGLKVEKMIGQTLKFPHTLEYEKTFYPFILLSKKRYVGNKYEFDINKYKQTSMGIVLKRRDNADIVKLVYGGVIDIIMNQRDIYASIDFLQSALMRLIDGVYPMEKLVVSKSLKPTALYKNPKQIAHWVLSQRMGERDPGNKPQSNDRIPYVYILTKETSRGKKVLQGERIETPKYILDNNIHIDYRFYITNQIMKPVCQIYDLIDGIDSKELFETVLKIAKQRMNKLCFPGEITDWFTPKYT